MELILSVKNGQYFLEKNDKTSEGNVGKRTNNQTIIYETFRKINSSALRITYRSKSARLYFGNGLYVTLKGYQNYSDLDLYSDILGKVNEKTRIQQEIDNINKKRFKSGLLTGAAILSLSAITVFGIHHSQNLEVPAATISITPTNTPTPIPTPTITPTPTIAPTNTPTPIPTIMPMPTTDERIEESLQLFSTNSNSEIIPLATKITEYSYNKMKKYFQTEAWQHTERYSSDFGVDKYLLLAYGCAETFLEHEATIPGGSGYNGYGVGMYQHETPDKYERDIIAYNYNTGEWETERMCMESACDLELNIKMATMILQNRLHKYDNNIYITIQSYNYGETGMQMVLEAYANELNCTVEDVIRNKEDIGWMKYVEDFHYNPQKYLPNWKHKTYGNEEYVKDVLGYYIGTESINMRSDGTSTCTNLLTMEMSDEEKSR